MNEELLAARLLIIDDEPVNIELLEQILQREGFTNVISTSEPEGALALYHAFEPDLVLLDLRMPRVDGYSLLSAFAEARRRGRYLPVVVLTADITREARHRALALGATDFLTKPFDTVEVMLRLWNLLETGLLYRRLQQLQPSLADPLGRPWQAD